ncbi:Bacteriophytochrome (Light-regulated signal transduction histidine kinase) [Planctomycetales bacterium 10988]|nr:Bacteriophytochrome (Light-regulated signal transduction histidine kinase) [Planctomycetales bacterium 10988]
MDGTLPDEVLAQCADEPIHCPDHIQPHGVLLVFDPETLLIEQASETVLTLLRVEVSALLGSSIEQLIGPQRTHYLRHWKRESKPSDGELLDFSFEYPLTGRWFQAIVHFHQGVGFFEIEQAIHLQGSKQFSRFLATQREVLRTLVQLERTCNQLPELLENLAQLVRETTYYDRVMIYRFDSDGSGKVVAENRSAELEPYLGLQYPATDIPAQARVLYLKNRTRLLENVGAKQVKVLPTLNPRTNQQADMSYCQLRSMSPVHVEYLQNMGVAATLVLSIVVDHQLWGLVACHHSKPKWISYDRRFICEVLAEYCSKLIVAQEFRDRKAAQQLSLEFSSRLLTLRQKSEDKIAALFESPDLLLAPFKAQGMAYWNGRIERQIGEVPTEENLKKVVAFLQEQESVENPFQTDRITFLLPEVEEMREQASGLFAFRLPNAKNEYLLWFRPEKTQTVNWAGDPRKGLIEEEGGFRLSPRKSFETWIEEARGISDPWGVNELFLVQSLFPYFL